MLKKKSHISYKMEGGLRLSIRLTNLSLEPTARDLRTPTPKKKLKRVTFGSVDTFRFFPYPRVLFGLHSPQITKNYRKARRFSI